MGHSHGACWRHSRENRASRGGDPAGRGRGALRQRVGPLGGALHNDARPLSSGVPCVAIAGMLGDGYESLMDSDIFHSCTSLLEHVPIEEAMGDPAAAIEHVSKKVSKMF